MASNRQSKNRGANFKLNWDWQLDYLPAIKEIIKKHAGEMMSVRIGTDKEDMEQSTDMVLEVNGATIAVRLRQSSYPYRDLTIRSSLPSGHITELQKLKQGYTDWYIYGWCDSNEIIEYILVNMDAVRKSGLLDVPRKQIRNYDGTKFIAISQEELIDAFAISAHWIK